MEYTPDVWVMLEIKTPKYTLYKVLAGWYGGFAKSDHWKLNSGVTKVEEEDNCYLFHGYSGSVYRCPKGVYRTSSLTAGVLDSFQYQITQAGQGTIEMMPEDTDWLGLNYE